MAEDGQLALSNLAASTVSTFMPKVGLGQWWAGLLRGDANACVSVPGVECMEGNQYNPAPGVMAV